MDIFEQASSPGVRVTTSENSDDLAMFISSEAKRRGELFDRSPELCQLIAEVLSTGADGMYLWASLMLDLLFPTHSTQPTVLEIQDLLEELPQSLSDVYEKLLARVHDRGRTRGLFQLITVARRPLSIGEVIDALSVNPGILGRETIVVLAKPVDLLKQLGGHLLYIEEEDETIHFIHDSAASHLMVQGRSSKFGFGVEEAQTYMGGICTAYLNLPEFSGSLQKPTLAAGSLTVSPEEIVNNVVHSTLPKPVQKPLGSIISRLSTRQSRRVDMTRILNELVASSSPPQQQLFHPYCKTFWLRHTKYSRLNAQRADRLWLRLMDNPGTLQFPWGLDKVVRLVWSLQRVHPSVLAYSYKMHANPRIHPSKLIP
ncbi:hypothetical protein F5X68DRAFT_259189 [Plectosphaerella plurivora]|uniref:GPI inositol-deacylase winged helix domain-containing protein n=1 Tax=Plectosphaerella plurivora TaxID=936078 RepID=A0A9P9AE93_9PEZI|nr:hypothetical protein F5X68DRAFT_259189 [Plectosphaerella plurivora]